MQATIRLSRRLARRTGQKAGYEAVGTALATVFFVVILIIPLGLFMYIFPRVTLGQDVQQFANTIRLDGYVTSTVFNEFSAVLQERGYTEEEVKAGVDVFVIDSPYAATNPRYQDGKSLIQTTQNLTPPIVARGKGMIGITVKLPANSGVFARATKGVGGNVDAQTRYYKIGRAVMSEAYGDENDPY